MTYLVVVWLLASGQFQAEPWRQYPTMEACEAAVRAVVSRDRELVFVRGCLDAGSQKEFTAIELWLRRALVEPWRLSR